MSELLMNHQEPVMVVCCPLLDCFFVLFYIALSTFTLIELCNIDCTLVDILFNSIECYTLSRTAFVSWSVSFVI